MGAGDEVDRKGGRYLNSNQKVLVFSWYPSFKGVYKAFVNSGSNNLRNYVNLQTILRTQKEDVSFFCLSFTKNPIMRVDSFTGRSFTFTFHTIIFSVGHLNHPKLELRRNALVNRLSPNPLCHENHCNQTESISPSPHFGLY